MKKSFSGPASLLQLMHRTQAACALVCALLAFAILPVRAVENNGETGVSLEAAQMTTNGFFQFSFQGVRGETYPVQASADLVHWTFYTNTLGGLRPVWTEDHDASNQPRRFFQIGSPPTPVTNMVFISPGTFMMGSPDSEDGRDPAEGPQTMVTISHGFWMGKYEVSQKDFISLMGSNVSEYRWDQNLPVEFVNWIHATNFCYNLTQRERAAGHLPAGYVYRLPTEAEWEYACRAGTTTPFAIGDGISLSSTQANFDGTFPYGGAPAGPYVASTKVCGSYQPNAWGLYDMHGNVWEWCLDWYGPYPGGQVTDPTGPSTGTAHVLRGGGLTSVGQACRSAKRDSRPATYAHPIQGFRVVLARQL